MRKIAGSAKVPIILDPWRHIEMTDLVWKIALSVLVLSGVGVATAHAVYRSAMSAAEAAYSEVAVHVAPEGAERFDPKSIAGLPEIARRYFLHAIEPGTPLARTVRLEMHGTFVLGNKDNQRPASLRARQALSPPDQFVWIASMEAGPMRISGSDGLVGGEAWTRFWLAGLFPVVDRRTSDDLIKAASARSAIESVWAPATLLPRHGVRWTQTGDNEAQVEFPGVGQPLHLVLGTRGEVLEIGMLRWSDANAEAVFRLQPFGGRALAEGKFSGYTIPTHLQVGNQFGTSEYFPFFDAEIDQASFDATDPVDAMVGLDLR